MTWLKRNRNAGGTIGFEEALEDPIEGSPDPEESLLPCATNGEAGGLVC
jgi:hypothetical protein